VVILLNFAALILRALLGTFGVGVYVQGAMVTLYIGGLDPQINESELLGLFADFGAITQTRMVTDDDGVCRGFAYVTFADSLAAAKARVALNGKEIQGQMLRVAMAT
jgi:RNA recognition motif-containing protein